MSLIYVADDDKNLCEILKQHLSNEGYEVDTFLSGESLLEAFTRKHCHLIISDIMMPGMNGYELCKAIRRISDIPFIMLSAKGEEMDRILGLELGSDDYISKPFSLREITIKVKNMLRRSSGMKESISQLHCKDISINVEKRLILINKREMKVTSREFDLIHYFLQNKNIALSREVIIEQVWGFDYLGDTRQVDHIIKRIRKKLLEMKTEFTIDTIWGYGYKVCDYEIK